MTGTLNDQIIAFAGIFQSASLVHDIAHKGFCNAQDYETQLQALFETDPPDTLAVFGGLDNLRTGLEAVDRVMERRTSLRKDVDILRYSLNLVNLERELAKHPDVMDVIGTRIDQARNTIQHFGFDHANTLRNIAGIYTDTISTFRLRINVTGDPQHLQVEDNAARIRALLLAGIRCAVLWRQLGGRRWHLIFRRGRLSGTARQLHEQLDGPSA